MGSQVVLQITKRGSREKHLLSLKRADFKRVDKVKDLYLTLAQLLATSKQIQALKKVPQVRQF